jgi:hypothetical protein
MATRRSAGQVAASWASSFWLAKESVGVAVAATASCAEPYAVMLFCSSMVENRHDRSPWCHALRGHDMDHSEVLEKQGDSSINRRWRTDGDGGRAGRQIASGCVKLR